MYTVKDPHMQFYNQCRQRDKSKEIQGPMHMKLISSYDRIKQDLELRSALPGQQPSDNWDVVPIIRQKKKNPNRFSNGVNDASKRYEGKKKSENPHVFSKKKSIKNEII